MQDNDFHRYSSDDFGAVEAPFMPSKSMEPSVRIAHALEYIASALSLLVDNPDLPPIMQNKMTQPHDSAGDHQVIRLEATDRHWPAH